MSLGMMQDQGVFIVISGMQLHLIPCTGLMSFVVPCTPFTGVNHHGQAVLFGCALVIFYMVIYNIALCNLAGKKNIALCNE